VIVSDHRQRLAVDEGDFQQIPCLRDQLLQPIVGLVNLPYLISQRTRFKLLNMDSSVAGEDTKVDHESQKQQPSR
jgi:hypothetical protein